jgi:hypothetical protein
LHRPGQAEEKWKEQHRLVLGNQAANAFRAECLLLRVRDRARSNVRVHVDVVRIGVVPIVLFGLS